MTLLKTTDDLRYRVDPVPTELEEAALSAARSCGYDRCEEHLLHAEVLEIRWVDTDSIRESIDPDSDEVLSNDAVVMVKWQTWAVPKHFHGQYEQGVVERVESIIVDADVLRDGQVLTYGLGPEYNWLHWEERSATGSEPPSEVYDSLSQLIGAEWRDDVRAHAEDDETYADRVHPSLRLAVTAALAGGD